MQAPPGEPSRFVALDVRPAVTLVCAVDRDGRVMLPAQRVAMPALQGWLRRALRHSDAVLLGTPADPWPLCDLIAPLVAKVELAHPQLGRLLPAFQHGDDPRDTLRLARMYAAGLAPVVWAAPPAVRNARALAAQRRRLILQHAEAGAVLARLLEEVGAVPPGKHHLGADQPAWWARLPLAPAEQQLARDNLAALNRAAALLRALEQRMLALAGAAPWREWVARLRALPGIDTVEALVLMSAIGAPERFATPAQLASYAGLAPGASAGGAPEGRPELRAAMLAIGARAAERDAAWGARYEALALRIGPERAPVAIARKLLMNVWRALATVPAARAVGEEAAQPMRPAA